MFAAVHRTLERAVGGVFPSAVLLVADDGELVLHRGYGAAERLDTVFDVASLTKALATSVAAMWLVDRGRLDLDAPAATWAPWLWRPTAEGIRVRHLLAHASGLPDWRPYFRTMRGRAVVRAAAREPLEAPVGRRAVYSDLGFILLGHLVEKAARRRLDQLFRDEVARPLGLRRSFFVDLADASAVAAVRRMRIAPTGRCAWRRRVLRGEVHDENAAAMGGVAGHAGLFSTAHDVHLLCRALVDAWSGGSGGPVSPEVVREFWTRTRVPGSTWCLGWDTPSARGSSAGSRMRDAVGHLGFTGCSVWLEPKRARWVVLLTNRVARGREPNRLKLLRPRIHDLAVGALDR